MGFFQKKKGKTLEELREENKKLIVRREGENELRKVQQENFRLKNRKSIAFFRGVTRGAESLKVAVVKKLKANRKNMRKLSKNRKPLNIREFI